MTPTVASTGSTVAAENKIKFNFFPYKNKENLHRIEKEVSGIKHRYLTGIASGSKLDLHGERITENAIRNMQEQGNSGNVLLYADKHGVYYTDDIGILTKSDIAPNGDWIAEFRLYDESDNQGQMTLERVNKLWKQINGIAPYTEPMQKGFSVEGYIPDDGILMMDEGGRRVIDNVILDGCVVVPRPAYPTSIAHSVYKALGEHSPWVLKKEADGFLETLQKDLSVKSLSIYKAIYYLSDNLEITTEKLLEKTSDDKQLTYTLDYMIDGCKELIIKSILQNRKPSSHGEIPQATSKNNTQILSELIKTFDDIEKKLTKELSK